MVSGPSPGMKNAFLHSQLSTRSNVVLRSSNPLRSASFRIAFDVHAGTVNGVVQHAEVGGSTTQSRPLDPVWRAPLRRSLDRGDAAALMDSLRRV